MEGLRAGVRRVLSSGVTALLNWTRRQGVETAVHLLVGHLAGARAIMAALARERLRPKALDAGLTSGEILDELGELRDFVERLRDHELALAAKLKQILHWGARLARLEPKCARVAGLYRAGTLPLVEALPQLLDRADEDFDTGDQALGFLKARGLVASERGTLEPGAILQPGDDYLVAGRAELGALRRLTEVFAKTVEVECALVLEAEPPVRRDILAVLGVRAKSDATHPSHQAQDAQDAHDAQRERGVAEAEGIAEDEASFARASAEGKERQESLESTDEDGREAESGGETLPHRPSSTQPMEADDGLAYDIACHIAELDRLDDKAIDREAVRP